MNRLLSLAGLFGLTILLVVAQTANANVSILAGPIVDPYTGYSLYLLNNSNWTDAESTAVDMGGNLATINSDAENQWIFNTFGDFGNEERFLWIGFYDPMMDESDGSHASNFVWVDGSPVTYTDWSSGEPNNNGGDEYWTELQTDSLWNDAPDLAYPYPNSPEEWGPVFGLVEITPEPSTLCLIACSASILLVRRRDKRNCHQNLKPKT